MSWADDWSAWRENQVEAGERDIEARAAFEAGYITGRASVQASRTSWHQSLSSALIAIAIVAAICYVLTGP